MTIQFKVAMKEKFIDAAIPVSMTLAAFLSGVSFVNFVRSITA